MADARAFELTQDAREKHGIEGVDGSISLDQTGKTLRIGERLRAAQGFVLTSHPGAIDFFGRDPNFKATSLSQAAAAGAVDEEDPEAALAGTAEETGEAPTGDGGEPLKGQALDDALDAAGLSKAGTVDEKRARLAAHDQDDQEA